jgi:DNA-binding XRE family transcriptional regulator
MDKISLKHLRASVGLTQKQLAEAAKMSEKAVNDIELGKSRPRLITAYAIVDALNVKLKKAGREEVTVESLAWNPL